jgi:hypothetical protein
MIMMEVSVHLEGIAKKRKESRGKMMILLCLKMKKICIGLGGGGGMTK